MKKNVREEKTKSKRQLRKYCTENTILDVGTEKRKTS